MVGQFHSIDVVASHIDRPACWVTAAAGGLAIDDDPSKRGHVCDLAASSSGALERLAFEWLPRYYVEEFAGRMANVSIVAPERKVVHANFLADVQSRFIAARYVAEGARLDFYQHGSGYGEIEHFALHHAESFMADRFLTWGWTLRPTDVPFLALRFIRPREERIRPRPAGATWLYVNQRPTFPWDLSLTLEIQSRFFGALNEIVARKAMLRPRVEKGGGWGCQISEQALRLIAAIDDGVAPFNDLVNRVGLVVFDAFPSTSFLECMQAGHPAIVIASEPVEFTSIAKPFYEEFFRMGLFHPTPEAAARFVNGLSVSKWWETVRTSDCLREFVRLFCRTRLLED
jgi:putative transferase (TIGR04331 family)